MARTASLRVVGPDVAGRRPVTAQDRALPDAQREPTISVERAAAVLGVSRRAVYDGIETGAVPAARLGRRVFVRTAAFLRAFGLVDES
jgi:excisionase family DNA binding protein